MFRAAELNGAPRWVAALSAALYTRAGQAGVAKVIIEDALTRKLDKVSEKRLRYRLQQVNAELKRANSQAQPGA